MIEPAIRRELENITSLPVYPLLLPSELLEGVTYQLISDPEVESGMVRTRLIAARYQIRISLLDDYTRIHALDRAIWEKWHSIAHGAISGIPVQYITRGNCTEQATPQINGRMLFSFTRDFIIYYAEVTA